MPIYEYKCTKCSKQFEVTQKMTDVPLIECESCGGRLTKLITSTSFVLKGSGWYVTDYPSAERKKALGTGKPANKSKDAEPEKKTETTTKKEETAKAK